MPPKSSKKPETPWQECSACGSCITLKDAELHGADCPPDPRTLSHHFVRDGQLFGLLDAKGNEEVKGLSQHERDHLVFMSQAGIQLCGLSIGEAAVVEVLGTGKRFVRTVWPTVERSLFSVLLTKNGMETLDLQPETPVKVAKISGPVCDATKLALTVLNKPRSLNLSNELTNRLHRSHLDRLVVRGDVLSVLFYGKSLRFRVDEAQAGPVCPVDRPQNRNLADEFEELSVQDGPVEIVKVTQRTAFVLFKDDSAYKSRPQRSDPASRLGGLSEETRELTDLMTRALGSAPFIPNLPPTRCVLLTGPPGTGKTLLAHAVARSSGAPVVPITPAIVYSGDGRPEDTLRELFRGAREACPCVVVVDEVEALCPARGGRVSEAERKVGACLAREVDELGEAGLPVFVVGVSSRAEGMDAGVRRAGRFEREIEVPVPNPRNRLDILSKLVPDVDKELLREVSDKTHGFVGADLVALSARAALHASQSDRTSLVWEDFKFALTRVRPSAMREVQIECPNVFWKDIGGQSRLKLILRQCVEWPLRHAHCFTRLGIAPPRGVLMYGPPGCSKTMIAKALATESGLNFISIKGPELFSKWVGESERAVREVIRRAREVAPSIVFFDEIDALGGERGGGNSVQERVLAQLLTELDGVTPLGEVTVLAATNRPDRIDKALLRPGRLDRIVYVPLPDEETRREIFRIKFGKMPIGGDVNLEELVRGTEGYSGAEVNAVCHEAAMSALEEDLEAAVVNSSHFGAALRLVTPRTPQSLLDIYEQYNKK